MSQEPPSFPTQLPEGYSELDDEPAFDPARHLALEAPHHVLTLDAFGYGADIIARCPTGIAVAGPFRILSEEGAAALQAVAARLYGFRRVADKRTASYVTGVVYRSRFIRDLVAAPALLDHLSGIAGTRLVPHVMATQQGYLNFAPENIEQDIDSWHTDSIGLDVVIAVTDPSRLKGGRLLYFKGTRAEANSLIGGRGDDLAGGTTRSLPEDRVGAVAFPGAGYGFFQQGNLVVHRAERLFERAERITLVPGFAAPDHVGEDGTNAASMLTWGEAGLVPDLARYKAWMARNRLDRLIEALPVDAANADIARRLHAALDDLADFTELLDASTRES